MCFEEPFGRIDILFGPEPRNISSIVGTAIAGDPVQHQQLAGRKSCRTGKVASWAADEIKMKGARLINAPSRLFGGGKARLRFQRDFGKESKLRRHVEEQPIIDPALDFTGDK